MHPFCKFRPHAFWPFLCLLFYNVEKVVSLTVLSIHTPWALSAPRRRSVVTADFSKWKLNKHLRQTQKFIILGMYMLETGLKCYHAQFRKNKENIIHKSLVVNLGRKTLSHCINSSLHSEQRCSGPSLPPHLANLWLLSDFRWSISLSVPYFSPETVILLSSHSGLLWDWIHFVALLLLLQLDFPWPFT